MVRKLSLTVSVGGLIAALGGGGGCSSDEAPTGGGPPSGGDSGSSGGAMSSSSSSGDGHGSSGSDGSTSGSSDASSNSGSTSGSDGGSGSSSGADAGGTAVDCDSPNLVWKTCNMTVYQSFPPPGSAECVQFNGCAYEGEFAYCSGKESESWVQSHNVVSMYFAANGNEGAQPMNLHNVCFKHGGKSIVGVVIDTCGNSDCSGCCSQNATGADALCDVELGLDGRFLNLTLDGSQKGVMWADLGANPSACK